MAQNDVCRSISTGGLVIDSQSDLLDRLSTRFLVPLVETANSPASVSRLNPILKLADQSLVMATQLAVGLPLCDLGRTVGSVASDRYTIQAALETLTGSY